MKKLIVALLCTAAFMPQLHADTRLPEYAQVEGVETKVDALASALNYGVTPSLENIQATLEALKIEFAKNRIATLTIRLNAPGTDYEVPSDPVEYAELLDGARLVFEQQGLSTPTVAYLDTLTNAVWSQTIYCNDASAAAASVISAKLGDSATCGYAVASQYTRLKDGDNITIDLTTHKVVGEHAQICRVQPYSTNANGVSNSGESYIAVKTLTPTGTVWRSGQYVDGLWQDGSLVKTVIWDCPGNEVNERILEDGCSEDAVDLMQTLGILRNLKIVYADFTGGSANILSNQFVRFNPVYIKTTRENVPVKVTENNITTTVYVDSIVRHFCDEKLDADYHLPGQFERYERQSDDSILATARPYAYIARYPIQFQTITIDGVSKSVARSLPDNSTEVGSTRAGFLNACRAINDLTITIHTPGESDIVIPAKSDPRAMSMAGMNDDALLENLAYLLLGANPQASLPGRMTTANGTASTKNGQSDYMVAKGVWNGAWSTSSQTNTIVCMGVEDGTWSSTGWMWPDVTSLSKRVMLTDATGVVTNGAPLVDGWIYALDRLDYMPCSSSTDYNNTTTTEDWLLANGYKWADFRWGQSSGAAVQRMGLDPNYGIRDAFIPCYPRTADNIKVGSDYVWHNLQAAPGNFSTSTAYAAGRLVYYDGKLWQSNTSVAAGAWNEEQWDLQTSREVSARSWFLVARGTTRISGSNLGLGCVSAGSALSYSSGYYWRGRLYLQGLMI